MKKIKSPIRVIGIKTESYEKIKAFCTRPDVRRSVKAQIEMMIDTLPSKTPTQQ